MADLQQPPEQLSRVCIRAAKDQPGAPISVYMPGDFSAADRQAVLDYMAAVYHELSGDELVVSEPEMKDRWMPAIPKPSGKEDGN